MCWVVYRCIHIVDFSQLYALFNSDITQLTFRESSHIAVSFDIDNTCIIIRQFTVLHTERIPFDHAYQQK